MQMLLQELHGRSRKDFAKTSSSIRGSTASRIQIVRLQEVSGWSTQCACLCVSLPGPAANSPQGLPWPGLSSSEFLGASGLHPPAVRTGFCHSAGNIKTSGWLGHQGGNLRPRARVLLMCRHKQSCTCLSQKSLGFVINFCKCSQNFGGALQTLTKVATNP